MNNNSNSSSNNSTIADDLSSLRGLRISGSDDMCMSPDDEDDEYNRLTTKNAKSSIVGGGGIGSGGNGNNGATNKEKKFVSALDRSPFGYATGVDDDDNALFPALVEDKDPWNNTTATTTHTKSSNILLMANETQESLRAWTPSPTKKGVPTFTFQGTSNIGVGLEGSSNKVLFENFADFEPFDPSSGTFATNNNDKTSGGGSNSGGSGAGKGSSKSVAPNPSPVSALLEDWRARKSGGGHRSIEGSSVGLLSRGTSGGNSGGGGGGSSSSFNSAPILTPSTIRGQVMSARSKSGGSSSISRVIDNLELHVNKHHGSSGGGRLEVVALRPHQHISLSTHTHSSHTGVIRWTLVVPRQYVRPRNVSDGRI